MARDVAALAQDIEQFEEMAVAAGTTRGPVTVMTGLPLDEPGKATERLAAFAELSLDRLVCSIRYDTVDEYRTQLDQLRRIIDRL